MHVCICAQGRLHWCDHGSVIPYPTFPIDQVQHCSVLRIWPPKRSSPHSRLIVLQLHPVLRHCVVLSQFSFNDDVGNSCCDKSRMHSVVSPVQRNIPGFLSRYRAQQVLHGFLRLDSQWQSLERVTTTKPISGLVPALPQLFLFLQNVHILTTFGVVPGPNVCCL